MSFSIELDRIIRNDCGNPLVFIDSLCFLNASLDNLVKFFWKNNYHCVSQEFNANVSNLVKLKRVYFYEYIDSFEQFKESLPSKDKFQNSLTKREFSDKNYEHFVIVLKIF